MGRRKGSAVAGTKHKAASSSSAQDLLHRQGMASGFIGFSSSRMAGGGISELDGTLRMAFRKVAKKDITTKLKAYADLLELLRPLDADALRPCLQPWVSVLNGLPLEHDRRVRLAGLRVHEVIVKGLGKNIAPELKNMFGSWAMLMNDRHKECKELALAIFESIFPANKREATWLYCKDQLVRTVCDTLGHQPETLCDMRKVTPAQAQDVWVQAVSACLGASSLLLEFMEASNLVAENKEALFNLYGASFWKLFSHKVAHVRRAAYLALSGVLAQATFIVEERQQKTAGNVLTALREDDQYACVAMVPLVIGFFQKFPASIDGLKTGQLRQAQASLSKFLENAAYGAAATCFSSLGTMITSLPSVLTTPHQSFFHHVLLNLWAGRDSKYAMTIALKQTVLEAYCRCAVLAVKAAQDGSSTEAQEGDLVYALARPFECLLSSPAGQLVNSIPTLCSFARDVSEVSERYLTLLMDSVCAQVVKLLSGPVKDLKATKDVTVFLCQFQEQTGITVITAAVLAAAFAMPGSGEVPSPGILVALASLVSYHNQNETLLQCEASTLADKFYLPWLKQVNTGNASEVELVCNCAVATIKKRREDGSLASRLAEEGVADVWKSAVETVTAKESKVACLAALLKAASGVVHDNRLLRCSAIDAIAVCVASGPSLATLAGRLLLDTVLSGGRDASLPLVDDEISETVVAALRERLDAFACCDPDEAQFSRAAVQAIVNGILVTNTVLKSAYFSGQHPRLQSRCMVTIFRLRACTKYYWKQLRLDAKAIVVFDAGLPADISAESEKERSPVALLANGVWEKRAEEFVHDLREKKGDELDQFLDLLLGTVHWSLRNRGSTWFNAELDAWQAASIWELSQQSPRILGKLLFSAAEWQAARECQRVVAFLDCNKEPLTPQGGEKKSEGKRDLHAGFEYPRLVRFVLQLCRALGDSKAVLGLPCKESAECRTWLVRELCSAYVLVRDALIPPLGQGSDWHDEWGIAVELLLENGEKFLFSKLRTLQDMESKEPGLCEVLQEFEQAICPPEEVKGAPGVSGELLASYAFALFIHTLISGDGERATALWKQWLLPRVKTALQSDGLLSRNSLWLLEATLPEVVSSLPPLELRSLGLVGLQENAIESLCSTPVAGKATPMVMSVLSHLLYTPLSCPTPSSDDLGAQLSCVVMWLMESRTWKDQLNAELFPFALNAVRLLTSIIARDDAQRALSSSGQTPEVLRVCANVLAQCQWSSPGHLSLVRSCLLLFRSFVGLGENATDCGEEVDRCLTPMFTLFLASERASSEDATGDHVLSLLSRTVAKWLPIRQGLLETVGNADSTVVLYRLLSARHLEVQKAACILLSAFYRCDGPIDETALPTGAEAMEMKESLLPERLEELLLSTKEHMAEERNASAEEEDVDDGDCPYVFQQGLQETVRSLLVWSLAMDYTFIQSQAVSRIIARWLSRTELIDSFLFFLFHLLRNNTGSITPAQNLSISALDARDEQSRVRFLAEVYLRVLETVPALVRSWWSLLRDRRLTAEVEKFTSQYISPVLVQKELQACADHEIEEYAEFEIRSNFRSRTVTAVFTEDDANTEVMLSLPESYPLRPVEVQCEHSKDVFRWRVWLAQDATLLKAVTMWMKYMEDLFDGIESCLICYSVYHDSKRTLPNLACKTCKNKFHSACLYKWFNTSHKSNCPLCQTPWMD